MRNTVVGVRVLTVWVLVMQQLASEQHCVCVLC